MINQGRTLALFFVTLFVTASAAAQPPGRDHKFSNDLVLAAIGVRQGVTVCEIGAGDGNLTLAAARIVGPDGRVYSSELGEDRVKRLQQNVEKSGLTQITVVAGDPVMTKFPDGACDALFMRNVYHHFADPAAMNASIATALKPGGRLAVVDFSPPNKEAESPADRDNDNMHGVTAETLARELKEAGFEPVSSEQGSTRWFMVVVSKPKPGAPA